MCPLLGGQVWGGISPQSLLAEELHKLFLRTAPLKIQVVSIAQQMSQYLRDFLVNQESKLKYELPAVLSLAFFISKLHSYFRTSINKPGLQGQTLSVVSSCFVFYLCVSCLSTSFCLQVPLYVSATTQEYISRDN